MNLNVFKYMLFFVILVGCGPHEPEIKNYGFSNGGSKNSDVSLKPSEFKDYGMFIDRIREVACNDSVPRIVIEQKNITRNIYPKVYCEPMIFDPEGKHYVTFRNGKPYEWQTIVEILPSSLSKKLTKDFLYDRNSKGTENFLIIIESERVEKMNGIEKFMTDLTLEYDKLETGLALNFAFWEVIPLVPPSSEKNEDKIKAE
ncbi:hypothetical protein [Aureisphaera sp.]